jgi:hypothetical protein
MKLCRPRLVLGLISQGYKGTPQCNQHEYCYYISLVQYNKQSNHKINIGAIQQTEHTPRTRTSELETGKQAGDVVKTVLNKKNF